MHDEKYIADTRDGSTAHIIDRLFRPRNFPFVSTCQGYCQKIARITRSRQLLNVEQQKLLSLPR